MLKSTLIPLFLFLNIHPFLNAKEFCHERPGALVIAHGSHQMNSHSLPQGHDHWNETVVEAINQAKKQVAFPMELAFGMWDEASFQQGVSKLASLGICELRIIPLFVSSYSEMVDVQKYMFGVNEATDFPIPVQRIKIPPQIQKVIYGEALNSHEFVSEILAERVAQISSNSNAEGLLFLAHGPYGNIYEDQWLEILQIHGERVMTKLKHQSLEFADVFYLTLRDDSPSAIREERTHRLRAKVQELNEKSITPVIIPLLLSAGGIEKGIFERLKGLNYKIQDQFLMPHEKIVDWIVLRANKPLDH